MAWKTGLTFFALATVLYATWALSAANMVSRWTDVSDVQVTTAFGYFEPLFRVPTGAMAIVGLVLIVVGMIGEYRPKKPN